MTFYITIEIDFVLCSVHCCDSTVIQTSARFSTLSGHLSLKELFGKRMIKTKSELGSTNLVTNKEKHKFCNFLLGQTVRG